MAFNASEEEIKKMFNLYGNMVNEIMKHTNTLVDNTKVWAGKIRYKPGVDMASDMVTFYNTELKLMIHEAMKKWADSESSFESFMKRKHAGESAINRGEQMKDEILDMVDKWPQASDEGLKHIDTTNPVVSSDDLKQLSELITAYSNDLSNIYDVYHGKVKNCEENNTLYTSIEPVFYSTYLVITDGFSQVKKAENNLVQEFEASEKSIRSGAAAAVKELGKKVTNSGKAGFETMRKSAKTLIE